MQLINPIWLWGLTGLLIPIGIHLLSRKEGKVIKFGSIRHLEESQTKQSINVRLNEVALLVMRCALIFLIVMLLSGLSIGPINSQKSRWMIVEQGLEQDPGIISLIDSLKQDGFEVKSMKKGFPDLSGQHSQPFANYWEMVDQIPLESLNKVIVVAYNYSSKFRGKRIPLPENVTWISKEPEEKEFTLSRVKFSDDSVLVRKGRSSSVQTSYTNLMEVNGSTSPPADVPLLSPDTVYIEIYAEPEYDYDRKIVTASLRAIERTIPVVFKISQSRPTQTQQNAKTDWLIWLSDNTPNEGIKSSNRVVLRQEGNESAPLLKNVTRRGDKQEWFFTRRLNEETALSEQLTLNLTSVLLRDDVAESRADSLDQTTRPEETLWSGNRQKASTSTVAIADNKTESFLFIAIVILLAAERFVAFKRNA